MNAYQLRVKDIIDGYKNFIFLSPHYDDAVLSCGYLIEKLHAYRKDVSVITVFTQTSEEPYTPQALAFLRASGHKDAKVLFHDRQREDVSALRTLGVKYIHLSYVDAAWRKSGWSHVYPNAKKQFSGSWSRQDNALFRELAMKLQRVIASQYDRKTVVFVPLGVGGHADHILVRDVAKTLNTPVFYWEDFPYSTNRRSYEAFFSKNKNYKTSFEIQPMKKTKKHPAIRHYLSQMNVLFPNGKVPRVPERYYTLKD